MTSFLYKVKGFSTYESCDENFVDSLRLSAHYLPGFDQMTNLDYMDGYAKRAWHLGYVIRSYSADAFVFDLIRAGLLTKTEACN